MKSSVLVKSNETTAAVISPNPYVFNSNADFEGNGNVECGCGEVRYDSLDKCRKCGDREIAAYRVSDKEKVLLTSTTAIKTCVWYHATRVANWDKKIKTAGVPVHLGNRKTAMDRGNDEYHSGTTRKYTLYKIILNPFASISDVVCPDLVNDWSEDMESFNAIVGEDFVRYVNAYENPGSVSIFGDPSKFIIVGKSTHIAS